MSYEEARRQARKLLGEKAELREMKNAQGEPVPVFKYVVGVMDKSKFLPLEAGHTWADALNKLNQRMQKTKS